MAVKKLQLLLFVVVVHCAVTIVVIAVSTDVVRIPYFNTSNLKSYSKAVLLSSANCCLLLLLLWLLTGGGDSGGGGGGGREIVPTT